MIEPEPLQQVDRTYVRVGRRKLSYFSGCDYFRLTSHPEVIAALHQGVEQFGFNVAASRLTSGNHSLYRILENRLAKFFGAEDALLVSTGYLSDLVAAQGLAGNFSHALIDSSVHPALLDAARFLECPVLQFKHGDAADLAAVVTRCGPETKLILLTDGMFSRDGSAAPLRQYLDVLPPDAAILVDDAHGAGVLGQTGKGAPEHARVSRRRIIQTVTLSKAFGCYGGAILCRRALRKRILQRSSSFVGSTPLPLPIANAAVKALNILARGQALRDRLRRNADYVRTTLRQAGLSCADEPGPIIPVFPENGASTERLRQALLKAGIYPPLIHYPGAPAGGYFRFVISSEHRRPQLDGLLKVLISFLAKGTRSQGGCRGTNRNI